MIFFTFSILMYLVQNISNKHFSLNAPNNSTGVSLVQNGICTLSSAIILILFNGIEFMSAGLTLLALLFGITYLSTIFLLIKAFTLGSMGNSTLLCNIGMFISAIYGIVKFKDDFSAFILIGGICMLLAVVMSVPRDNNPKSCGKVWFMFALLSGVSNGVTASVKREAVALCPDNPHTFLTWGFLFAAIISFIILSANKVCRNQGRMVLGSKALICCGIGAGIGTAGANLFQMLAVKTVSSAIIFPFTAGFLVVSLWLLSLLVYKETKLKLRNILSVILCLMAIILINIK